ncbi:hypothetical protein TNCT_137401 [Trichonephila clavata]|uniref:Uncharacterized protein n=1 Tax=Trichonephila clavata TaxID=2740835 RepID=A0A8X6K1Z2_TRICU|nr:hypothetical protein TNCT_137401 [Trichonephila clavata]
MHSSYQRPQLQGEIYRSFPENILNPDTSRKPEIQKTISQIPHDRITDAKSSQAATFHLNSLSKHLLQNRSYLQARRQCSTIQMFPDILLKRDYAYPIIFCQLIYTENYVRRGEERRQAKVESA